MPSKQIFTGPFTVGLQLVCRWAGNLEEIEIFPDGSLTLVRYDSYSRKDLDVQQPQSRLTNSASLPCLPAKSGFCVMVRRSRCPEGSSTRCAAGGKRRGAYPKRGTSPGPVGRTALWRKWPWAQHFSHLRKALRDTTEQSRLIENGAQVVPVYCRRTAGG